MLFNKTTGTPEKDNIEDITLSTESCAKILEAVLMDECDIQDLQAFLEDNREVDILTGASVLLEKNIVRLDKQTKIKRATKVAAFELAKQHKDPKFKKLLTVWRMERFLEDQLMKKYGTQAQRVGRQQVMNASRKAPASKLVKKVASKLNSSLNVK